ncbi:hypothetical protein BOTBODRAFT_414697 [Botryobasidium botryosum FD-172 SS1]|uniref:Uracil catabolism protein 4 n=1 Tax=Botryobasidium botryosum (strain FD-172 SS1) TaxID=930990 RepID=A0A067MCJ3_BOTB1|nr:hypothetical protein BOTBODRAFT_414697 [Botryobasidium botryosum FD-172 SS1]
MYISMARMLYSYHIYTSIELLPLGSFDSSTGLPVLSSYTTTIAMEFAVRQTSETKAAYLQTLPAIRERCSAVHALARQGKLEYFDYHPEKEADVIDFCIKIIERDFGSDYNAIPPHSRWRHFDAGKERISPLLSAWTSNNVPKSEICKRLLDLFLVSVLMDAGAGNQWAYTEKGSSEKYTRSEGLAVASLDMFKAGFFSGDESEPFRVDAIGLSRITPNNTAAALQVDPISNPIIAVEGRANLLASIGDALQARPDLFGADGRAGNLIDFLGPTALSEPATGATRVHIASLFQALIQGLAPIWPSRIQLGGISLGDVWPCSALRAAESATTQSRSHASALDENSLVPFHKLTQWLTYSLVEPIEKVLGWKFDGMEDMTGLPEYRNGGLLVDFGVLSLRREAAPSFYGANSEIPRFPSSHSAIVEWRAMTVIELDRIAEGIRQRLKLAPHQLSLVQVLESATWKGGREIAKEKRPATGGPPIDIESDGTVF